MIPANFTLDQIKGNNTSCPSTFVSMSNGNLGARNVSKINYRTLCPAFKGKIKGHVMPWWWPDSSHTVGPGYNEQLAATAKAIVDDMVSRGCDGMVVAEGFTNDGNSASQLALFNACKGRTPTFEFTAMITKWVEGSTSQVEAVLDQLFTTYIPDPCYCRFNGRPVVYVFNSGTPVDFVACKTYCQGKYGVAPIFIFRHKTGYAAPGSEGAYSWVGDDSTPDLSTWYLNDFYSAFQPTKFTAGTVYKGFNDSLAAWTPASGARIIDQQGGKTWLDSWALLNSNAPNLQEVEVQTWSDYEEGTEVESGIDGGLSLVASAKGTIITGVVNNLANLGKMEAYVSQDGQNFAMVPMPSGSVDIAAAAQLGAGSYQVLVKATGLPGFANEISAPLVVFILSPTPTTTVIMRESSLKLVSISLALSNGSAITKVTAVQSNGLPVQGLTLSNISKTNILAMFSCQTTITSVIVTVWNAAGQVGLPLTVNV